MVVVFVMVVVVKGVKHNEMGRGPSNHRIDGNYKAALSIGIRRPKPGAARPKR